MNLMPRVRTQCIGQHKVCQYNIVIRMLQQSTRRFKRTGVIHNPAILFKRSSMADHSLYIRIKPQNPRHFQDILTHSEADRLAQGLPSDIKARIRKARFLRMGLVHVPTLLFASRPLRTEERPT